MPDDKYPLDVDHIAGDNSNNEPDSYMTLCANCHRLKTMIEGDHLKRITHGGSRVDTGAIAEGGCLPGRNLGLLINKANVLTGRGATRACDDTRRIDARNF